MTYMDDIKPDTSNASLMLESAEMRIVQRITGKTSCEREMSEDIRRLYEVQSIQDCKTKKRDDGMRI